MYFRHEQRLYLRDLPRSPVQPTVVWQARRTRLKNYSSPIAGVHPDHPALGLGGALLVAMSDDEATHPESDGSAHVTPQRLPSLSNLASPAPPPLSSEGLANGPIAHRLPARRARVPEGFKYPK